MMRRILPFPAALILILFFIALLPDCAHEPEVDELVWSRPRVKGGFPGRIEIPFDYDIGIPYITAEIEGIGPCRFVYDTGTSRSSLTEGLIEELGLKPRAVQKVRGGEERIKGEAYILPPIRFGSLKLKGITAYRHEDHDIEWLRSCRNAGGILAWTVFNGFVVTVDYGRNCLILDAAFPSPDSYRLEPLLLEFGGFDRTSVHVRAISTIVTAESYSVTDEAGDSASYLPFIWRNDKVTIPVRVEGIDRNLLFILDTGSAMNLIRPELVDTTARPHTKRIQRTVGTFEGQKSLDSESVLSILHVGLPAQIRTREILVLDQVLLPVFQEDCHWSDMVDGILGTPFLSKYAVTIDRGNRMVVLRPLGGGSDAGGESSSANE